jgi:hypothetical protein
MAVGFSRSLQLSQAHVAAGGRGICEKLAVAGSQAAAGSGFLCPVQQVTPCAYDLQASLSPMPVLNGPTPLPTTVRHAKAGQRTSAALSTSLPAERRKMRQQRVRQAGVLHASSGPYFPMGAGGIPGCLLPKSCESAANSERLLCRLTRLIAARPFVVLMCKPQMPWFFQFQGGAAGSVDGCGRFPVHCSCHRHTWLQGGAASVRSWLWQAARGGLWLQVPSSAAAGEPHCRRLAACV